MDNLTTNRNYLSPANFKVTLDPTKFANLTYFCVSARLPGLSGPGASLPFRAFSNEEPPDRLDYGTFDIRFLVDEDMANYLEIFNWLVNNARSQTRLLSDITLSILDSKNNANQTVVLHDCFPVAIGGVDFTAQTQDIEHVTLDASFRFTFFEFVPNA